MVIHQVSADVFAEAFGSIRRMRLPMTVSSWKCIPSAGRRQPAHAGRGVPIRVRIALGERRGDARAVTMPALLDCQEQRRRASSLRDRRRSASAHWSQCRLGAHQADQVLHHQRRAGQQHERQRTPGRPRRRPSSAGDVARRRYRARLRSATRRGWSASHATRGPGRTRARCPHRARQDTRTRDYRG